MASGKASEACQCLMPQIMGFSAWALPLSREKHPAWIPDTDAADATGDRRGRASEQTRPLQQNSCNPRPVRGYGVLHGTSCSIDAFHARGGTRHADASFGPCTRSSDASSSRRLVRMNHPSDDGSEGTHRDGATSDATARLGPALRSWATFLAPVFRPLSHATASFFSGVSFSGVSSQALRSQATASLGPPRI